MEPDRSQLSMGKGGVQGMEGKLVTAIHFSHLLSQLSLRSKRKRIFSFLVRGLSSTNSVNRKEETREAEAGSKPREVRGHKRVGLGAKQVPFCVAYRVLCLVVFKGN